VLFRSGADIRTTSGLAEAGVLHPLQRAFLDAFATQCGFCTPGMIMAADSLIREHEGELTEQDVRLGLEGNLCRCTGYQNIVKSILAAAQAMRATPAPTA